MSRFFSEHGGDIYANSGITLDFSVNTNPLGMPEAVKRAIVEHMPDYERYPDFACRALRAALAERHGVEPSMIRCGNGASELILALCACVKPRQTLVLAPTFSEYARSARLFGGQVRTHRLSEKNGFALTQSILAALTPETDLLFLCNPNNPTGQLTDRALLRQIADTCRGNKTLLLLDECFVGFTRGESMVPLLAEYPNLLVLQAFTKMYAMAGLRLGMLFGADKALLTRIAAFCPAWNVSGVAQAAGLAALSAGDWIEATQKLVENERAFMAGALGKLGIAVGKSDANFLLLRSEKPLFAPLRERGILVRSCANFPGLSGCYTRIGLKTRDENTALLRALSEVVNG